jgi:hypothetical protein
MLSSGSRALFVDDAWPFVVHSNGFCIRFGWFEKQNCWQFVGGPDAGTGRRWEGEVVKFHFDLAKFHA